MTAVDDRKRLHLEGFSVVRVRIWCFVSTVGVKFGTIFIDELVLSGKLGILVIRCRCVCNAGTILTSN